MVVSRSIFADQGGSSSFGGRQTKQQSTAAAALRVPPRWRPGRRGARVIEQNLPLVRVAGSSVLPARRAARRPRAGRRRSASSRPSTATARSVGAISARTPCRRSSASCAATSAAAPRPGRRSAARVPLHDAARRRVRDARSTAELEHSETRAARPLGASVPQPARAADRRAPLLPRPEPAAHRGRGRAVAGAGLARARASLDEAASTTVGAG